jgi:luciferase family oxidoreductase group 1
MHFGSSVRQAHHVHQAQHVHQGGIVTTPLALSVLDLVPVSRDQSSAGAVAASISLARRADELGYTRLWFAEHHNMASVASTAPPIMIGLVAASTERIRVGAGGVMLPNHAPFVVAEQFAVLEAAAPGRIDLGIGRAPGSDPVITALLRQSGATSDVERFPSHIADIMSLLSAEGAQLTLRDGETYEIHSTPAASSRPDVWLLGSSDYSASVAAQLGLPYVFAHHFSGDGTQRALDLYRGTFRPSTWLDAPKTFLTVNAVVADSAEEAEARALPNLIQMSRLRTGKPMQALDRVEEAEEAVLDAAQEAIIATMRERWVLGDPGTGAAKLRDLAATFAVDEVMVSVGAGRRLDDPPSTNPARERTLDLLAKELLPAI